VSTKSKAAAPTAVMIAIAPPRLRVSELSPLSTALSPVRSRLPSIPQGRTSRRFSGLRTAT
jgi:hypothetical protein